MFTMDTESGFDDAVFITSSYGLGEAVVQGAVNPDEFYVCKPGLAPGTPAVLKRGLGAKATKMIFTDDPSVGRTTEFVDVDRPTAPVLASPMPRSRSWPGWPLVIEEHYGRPMDIEWGKDGVDGKLYVLQARPETVQSRQSGTTRRATASAASGRPELLVEGRAIGQKVGAGRRTGAGVGRADARLPRRARSSSPT